MMHYIACITNPIEWEGEGEGEQSTAGAVIYQTWHIHH